MHPNAAFRFLIVLLFPFLWGCTTSVGIGAAGMRTVIPPGQRLLIVVTGEDALVQITSQGADQALVIREDSPRVEIPLAPGHRGRTSIRGVKGGDIRVSVLNRSDQPAAVEVEVSNARSVDITGPVVADQHAWRSIRQAIDPRDVPCLAALGAGAGLRKLHSGTGARISESKVVTCAHVWPADAFLATVNGEVEGLWKVLAHGSGPGSRHDWVVLGTDPAPKPGYLVDPSFTPAPGDQIVVCGYPASQRSQEFPEKVVPPLQMLDGHVVKPPQGLTDVEDLIFFRTSQSDLQGLSGGPALAWDARRGKAVLFGVVTETIVTRIDGVAVDRVHAVRSISFAGSQLTQP